MAKLFADENFPLPVVMSLRTLGHDVLTLQESGQGGLALDDPSVLAAATGDGRALVTLNRRDFIRLHNQRPDHAGIVVCTFDPDFSGRRARTVWLHAGDHWHGDVHCAGGKAQRWG